MTAIQLFRFNDTACLVTDGAGFDTDGRVVALGSKLILTGDYRMAVSWSGYASAQDVSDAINRAVPAGTVHDQIKALPKVVADLKRAAVKAVGRAGQDFTLYAATCLEDGPRCYVVTTMRSHGLPTMKLVETDGCMVPGIDVTATLAAAGITAPKLDAIAMLAAQRREPNPHYGGCSTVGGACQMAIVSADQIEIIDLIAWPDRIGERIVA